MPKNNGANGNGAQSAKINVVLPFERATKNTWRFSTLESRDKDKAKESKSPLDIVYVKKVAGATAEPKEFVVSGEVKF